MEALFSDTWYQEVRAEIESKCALKGIFLGYFLESDGLLQNLGHIHLPVSGDLRTLVMSKAHHAPYFAHPGIKKMHADLKQLYFWVGMRNNVVDFIT